MTFAMKNSFSDWTLLPLAIVMTVAAPARVLAGDPKPVPGVVAKVKVTRTGDRYQLLVNGQPFLIKGAGLEFGDQEKLALHGGNSFRTWRTENGQSSGREVLDRALRNGLFVTMGLEIARERHGFNYDDPAAVERQLQAVKAEVLKYKDHPALLLWGIGNELNLNAKNPKVWDAVNAISRMIHEVDPNHPTMTMLAGIGPDTVQLIKSRAPDLDLLGIQMYADIVNLPRYLKETGWTGPYVVTEWGATGHWEVGKTAWDAPLENDSTTKADYYLKRFDAAIRPDQRQCLGSYVFLWGQKQERTPTWYGMFLESGEETATVDTMHFLWNGSWPANQSPRLSGARLDGKGAAQSIRLRPGQRVPIEVQASDPDHDDLIYRWEVMEESTDLKTGGDLESKPQVLSQRVERPTQAATTLQAPDRPGAYRLFVYVFDGRGHAAHANIPFHVDPAPPAR
jgi:hypothetical protein